MILKTKNGDFIELSKLEYNHFVAQLMVEFEKEKKLDIHFQTDTRVEAANMLLQAAASNRNMPEEIRADYFRTAHEIQEFHNNRIP